MNKRGQFYLVAAIIIIGIVFGLYSAKNYVKTEKEDVRIYDLSNELKEEGARVVDYGIYNSMVGVKSISERFIKEISEEYLGEKVNNILVGYGNEDNIYVKKYEEIISGDISLGGTSVKVKTKSEILLLSEDIIEEKVEDKIEKVTIVNGGLSYGFDLEEGENFFIILEKEVENEKHIEVK